MKYLNKWFYFIKKRFNPILYAIMIFVFVNAHYAVYINFFKQSIVLNSDVIFWLISFMVIIYLFFFKLRLFDEIKDVEFDKIYYSDRPLPQGILSKKDLLIAAFIIIIIEILFFSFYGFWSFLSILITVSYSLIMYKEFFIKKWLRDHLTIYAISHTFVVVLISITIFTSLINKIFSQIPKEFFLFSFSNWFFFNIFEFARKTFAKDEERVGVDSYSKKFGKIGAVLIVLIMIGLNFAFINKTITLIFRDLLFVLLTFLMITGLLYTIFDHMYFAKIYRIIAIFYPIFTYGVIILSSLISIVNTN
jgi:4-hydroxybenzoate polyprenyltransferase